MEIAIRLAQLLLSLSILVVLHELGHFLAARYFGTRVEKFYLFFNPGFSLFKKKIGETEYGIGWLPLGGYVKISGMIDESMDTEQMAQEPQPWEFRTKPAWQRLIIMLGGIIVNVIVGFFIYTMLLWSYGETVLPNKNLKDGLMIGHSLARDIGFQNGDKIISIDGKEVEYVGKLMEELAYSKTAQVDRNGEIINLDIPVDLMGQLTDLNEDGRFFSPRIPFVVGALQEDSPNKDSGLEKGDSIVAINGISLKYFDQGSDILAELKSQSASMDVYRDNNKISIPVQVSDKGTIGIQITGYNYEALKRCDVYEFDTRTYTFLESIPAGYNKMVEKLTSYIRQFSLIFNKDSGAVKGLGGFGAISKLFGVSWNWPSFWSQTAFLSLILAFMNLLPIPALDGGHVMFLLYEMVTGKEPNQKFLEYAQLVGFILLLALLLFANGNDVYRWWIHR